MAAKNWPTGMIPPNGNPAESVPSVSTSDGTNENDSETGADDDPNDAEGVWSPDIEQSFQEALAIYPPCGRRKIILSDEGKMYGRNELIARYIKVRTGKTRTRKQVSSHIQVLARRKSKDIHSQLKHCNPMAKEKALQGLNALSSSQIVSASALRPPNMPFTQHPGMHGMNSPGLFPPYPAGIPTAAHPSMDWTRPPISSTQPFSPGWSPGLYPPPSSTMNTSPTVEKDMSVDIKPVINERSWLGRSISSDKLRLCEFTAFYDPEHDENNRKSVSSSRHILVEIGNYSPSNPLLEDVDIRQIYDKFPSELGGLQDLYEKGPHNAFFLVKFWADLSCDFKDETSNTLYAVDCRYESSDQMNIICSTKVCSFGRQVVEKVETQYGKLSSEGRFIYTIDSSKMCDYMITFICRLKQLSDNKTMNSVLENFTILQVIQNKETLETLLCLAMVFEVATQETGRQHNTYRLIKE